MKRSVLWMISIGIGVCFVVLLVLQSRYTAIMVTMRKEQFDESVFRALDQTSRDLERNETFRYLEALAEQMRKAQGTEEEATYGQVESMLELGDSLQAPFRLSPQA